MKSSRAIRERAAHRSQIRMLTFATDELTELKSYCSNVASACEGGCTYLLLEKLVLPDCCTPSIVDALLCPTPRDGYQSRLFFGQPIISGRSLNWNANGIRILDRNWHAFSWKVERPNLRLAEILIRHLEGFTRC